MLLVHRQFASVTQRALPKGLALSLQFPIPLAFAPVFFGGRREEPVREKGGMQALLCKRTFVDGILCIIGTTDSATPLRIS